MQRRIEHLSEAACVLRPATPADAETILSLRRHAFESLSAADYTDEAAESLVATLAGHEREAIASGRTLVAVVEGRIVGAGSWCEGAAGYDAYRRAAPPPSGEPPAAAIEGLYVDPAFARSGIASRLVARLELEARRAGFSRIRLATAYAAMPFFTRMGYAPQSLVSLDLPGGGEIHGAEFAKPLHVRLVRDAAKAA